MHYGNPPAYIAEGLIKLRRRIALAKIPPSKLDETLNVAVWNIREFGQKPRMTASIYYIAEILSYFDLIVLVELRDNLGDLKRVMDLLGPYWRVMFSDHMNDSGGNSERIAYLYDKRMITFTGLAAEADPPRAKVGAEYLAAQSWWRAPYMASFRAGNFDFVMLATHIRWGDATLNRLGEIEALADWVKTRREEPFCVDVDFIVTGDFNIPSRRSALYKAVEARGLVTPASLLNVSGTNLSEQNTYDQILVFPTNADRFTNAGGTVNFYQNDWLPLYPDPKHRPTSATRFTYEMSDHLPLWVQIDTDIVDERLQLLTRCDV